MPLGRSFRGVRAVRPAPGVELAGVSGRTGHCVCFLAVDGTFQALLISSIRVEALARIILFFREDEQPQRFNTDHLRKACMSIISPLGKG